MFKLTFLIFPSSIFEDDDCASIIEEQEEKRDPMVILLNTQTPNEEVYLELARNLKASISEEEFSTYEEVQQQIRLFMDKSLIIGDELSLLMKQYPYSQN